MKIDDLTTPEYRALLRERYTRKGWGASGYHHAEEVICYAAQIGATTVLDYGCGRGTLKQRIGSLAPGMNVREYDPGIVGKDAVPEPADLLVATDVLEHVEPDLLDETLRFMRTLARKGAFLIIATSLAKETLADGRNAHLIVQKSEWWMAKIEEVGFRVIDATRRKGFWVWCRHD
jgi:predicted TPR repeat methyltransferase